MKIAHNEQYDEAYNLFDQLFSISIPNEYDDITIDQLFNHEIISISHVNTLYTYAHCALMCKRKEERASALFNIVTEFDTITNVDFNLEKLLKFGAKSIPDEEAFYQEWIQYLNNQEADTRGKRDAFLIDALTNSGGINSLRHFANENGMLYPDVVFKLLQLDIQNEHFNEAVETIKNGFKELDQIDKNRTELADYLIEVSKISDNDEYFKEGTIEGFKSSLNLKYYTEIHSWQEAELIIEMLEYLEINKEKVIPFDYYCIQFLNGNYDLVWNECAKDLRALGWSSSSSLKGQMFPLFLAILTKGEFGEFTLGLIREMRKDLIYFDFDGVLSDSIRELTDEEYQKYLQWCKNQIKLRVDAIVGGQKRGAYERASALIVAMGEVMMANYDERTGMNYIREFKLAYPRHSAFQRCLKDDVMLIGVNLVKYLK